MADLRCKCQSLLGSNTKMREHLRRGNLKKIKFFLINFNFNFCSMSNVKVSNSLWSCVEGRILTRGRGFESRHWRDHLTNTFHYAKSMLP